MEIIMQCSDGHINTSMAQISVKGWEGRGGEGGLTSEQEHAWSCQAAPALLVLPVSPARAGHSAVSCNNKETVRLTGGQAASLLTTTNPSKEPQ